MTNFQLAVLIAEAAAPEVGLRSGLGIDLITRYLKGENLPGDHARKIDQAVGNILVSPPPKLKNGCLVKLEIKILEMDAELEKKQNQLAEEKETVHRLQRTVESTQDRNSSLQEEVKVLKKNNKNRGVQIDKLSARVLNQQEVIDKLRKDNERLEAEKNSLHNICLHRQHKIDKLEFDLHDPSVFHEAKIAGLLHEISHLRNYIEKTNQPNQDARVRHGEEQEEQGTGQGGGPTPSEAHAMATFGDIPRESSV